MNPLVGFSELWGPTSLTFILLSPHTLKLQGEWNPYNERGV